MLIVALLQKKGENIVLFAGHWRNGGQHRSRGFARARTERLQWRCRRRFAANPADDIQTDHYSVGGDEQCFGGHAQSIGAGRQKRSQSEMEKRGCVGI